MEKPIIKKSELICDIKRGKNNPRNSEGDFIRLKNGNILFAFCRYEGDDAHDDAKCNIAGMLSEDNGNTFTPLDRPLVDAASHGVINVMSVSLERLQDGTLCIFYLCKYTPQSAVYMRRVTDEDKLILGEPELLVPCRKNIYYVINNARICIAPDGSVLIPVAEHPIVDHGTWKGARYFGYARVFGCDADGRNPRAVSSRLSMPYPGHTGTGLQEPGLVNLPDGRVYAYFRTDRAFQYESFSADNGRTWTRPIPSRFTSPDSPMLILRNPYSGVYYSLWNPVPNYNGRIDPGQRWISAGRTPFVIAASEDGIEFSPFAVIEDDPTHGYCYPAMLFLSEKEMLISYCCGGEEDEMCLTRTAIRKITLE